MPFVKLRIQTRIVLPFFALFLFSHVLVAWFSARAVTRQVERQFSESLVNVSSMLSRAGFPLNVLSLQRIKNIVGYDLAVRSGAGQVVFSTLPRAARSSLEGLDIPPEIGGVPAGHPWSVRISETTYWVAASRVRRNSFRLQGATLFLLSPSSRVAAVKWKAALPVLMIASSSLLLLLLLGYLVARSLASPIQRLSREVKTIGRRGLEGEITLTAADEVGELAEAFRQMLDSLRDSQQRMIESARLASLGQLSASMAHEIRNPLSSLRMTAQVLEKRLADDADCAEPLRIIREEIDRLDFAVSEVLAFARPGRPDFQPIRAAEIFYYLEQLMSRQLQHAGIELLREYEPSAPTRVMGDERQLKQVFMNLVLNAVQAMPSGGSLTLRMCPAAPGWVAMEVGDTGHGIPAQYQPRIYEPFFTSREGGAGLGLVVCKQIVQEHRGSIGFNSSPAGTCFRVELPATMSSPSRLGEQGPLRPQLHESAG